ncbi:MAG: hypothetical protein ACHQF4_08465 [Sphingobacteriales bacterium]
MKPIFLLLMLSICSFSFAQKADIKYSITINSVNTLTFERYSFAIIKNNDEVSFKYSLSDSVQRIDTLSFNLNSYPNYRKLLDSVYSGGDFKDKKRWILDGVGYSIEVKSQTVNHDYETTSPDDNINPTLYHLIRDTFVIYRQLSKHPLVYHKHNYSKG